MDPKDLIKRRTIQINEANLRSRTPAKKFSHLRTLIQSSLICEHNTNHEVISLTLSHEDEKLIQKKILRNVTAEIRVKKKIAGRNDPSNLKLTNLNG
jgi:hypothetical protein